MYCSVFYSLFLLLYENKKYKNAPYWTLCALGIFSGSILKPLLYEKKTCLLEIFSLFMHPINRSKFQTKVVQHKYDNIKTSAHYDAFTLIRLLGRGRTDDNVLNDC